MNIIMEQRFETKKLVDCQRIVTITSDTSEHE